MTGGTLAALQRLSDAGRPDLATQLDRLVSVIASQATTNADFAEALGNALGASAAASMSIRPSSRNTRGRRPPGPFDPYEVYLAGEHALRRHLAACDLEQLKDIVAEHGMDHDRLAMKWKTPERLTERIVETVIARTRKGDAFRSPMPSRSLAAEVEARIELLNRIHARGSELRRRPSLNEPEVQKWLDEVLSALEKGERWSVQHAPPVHSAAEEPDDIKRWIENLLQGLRDVITNQEAHLYGLIGRTS